MITKIAATYKYKHVHAVPLAKKVNDGNGCHILTSTTVWDTDITNALTWVLRLALRWYCHCSLVMAVPARRPAPSRHEHISRVAHRQPQHLSQHTSLHAHPHTDSHTWRSPPHTHTKDGLCCQPPDPHTQVATTPLHHPVINYYIMVGVYYFHNYILL